MCVFELTYIICTGLFILTDPMSQQREVADDLYLSNPFDRRVRWEIKNDDVIIGPTMYHAQFNSIQLLWNYAQDEIPSRDFAVTLSDGQHSNDMTLSSTVHSDSHHIRQNNTHEKFIGNLIKQN